MSDKSFKKTLIHLTEQDIKIKKSIKDLEKRFNEFTKFNKRIINKLEKKIIKLEQKGK